MRFEDAQLDEFMLMDDGSKASFYMFTTNELLEAANAVRAEAGFTDMATPDAGSEIYYNFYLEMDAKRKRAEIVFTANFSEKDDYADYKIPLSKDESWKLFRKGIEACIQEDLARPDETIEEFVQLANLSKRDVEYSIYRELNKSNSSMVESSFIGLDGSDEGHDYLKIPLKETGVDYSFVTLNLPGVRERGNTLTEAERIIRLADLYEPEFASGMMVPAANTDPDYFMNVHIPRNTLYSPTTERIQPADAERIASTLNDLADELSSEYSIPRYKDNSLDMKVTDWMRELYPTSMTAYALDQDMPGVTFRDMAEMTPADRKKSYMYMFGEPEASLVANRSRHPEERAICKAFEISLEKRVQASREQNVNIAESIKDKHNHTVTKTVERGKGHDSRDA